MPRPTALRLDPLEPRDVPAVAIQFDYSRDTSGFFTDPARRAALQRAADDITARLPGGLSVIAPSGTNSWRYSFESPGTGATVTVSNATIAADTLVVYVGGRSLPGTTLGEAGPGFYSSSGSSAWVNLVGSRGVSGFSTWGGAMTFDADGSTNWYFGTSAAVPAGQADFYSVAAHELGHVLGVGTSDEWDALAVNGAFVGPASVGVYGGGVPLSADGGHWADGVTVGGQSSALDPVITLGTRVGYSPLDFAGLRDIGWSVSAVASGRATVLAAAGNGVVVANFAGFGLSRYTPASGWQSLGTGDASLVSVNAAGDVAAYFPGYGLYRARAGQGFVPLYTNPGVPATALGIDGAGNVVANFAGYGLQRFTTGWQSLGTGDANALAVGADGTLVASFTGYGVYRMAPASAWTRLTGQTATVLATDATRTAYVDPTRALLSVV